MRPSTKEAIDDLLPWARNRIAVGDHPAPSVPTQKALLTGEVLGQIRLLALAVCPNDVDEVLLRLAALAGVER